LVSSAGLVLAPYFEEINHQEENMDNCNFWIDIATALGTFLAAAIALGLGVHSVRQNRTEKRMAGELYAASITAQLTHTRDVLMSCIAAAVFSVNRDKDEHNSFALFRIKERLTAHTFRPSANGLLALSALGGKTANRIARAFDHIDLIKHQAAGIGDDLFKNDMHSIRARSQVLDEWKKNLQQAQELLLIALADCIKASELAAPLPSALELHGPDQDHENE
jgi:hypothetical protein